MTHEYIRVTHKYIRVTYRWHTSTYEWHTSTYEWHTADMRVHTSDIRMTHEYIRVTYGWHTSTYEWHTDDMRVHTDDMWFKRKIKVLKVFSFTKYFFQILFQNIWFAEKFLTCNGCFGLFTKIKKGSGISFWCTFSARFFHTNALYLILHQMTKLQRHIFLTSYLDNWWRHKLQDFLQSSSKQWPRERRISGTQKYKNLSISRTKRTFYMV